MEKLPKKSPNVYISGPLYSIRNGGQSTTGALVEYSSEALNRETSLRETSLRETNPDEEVKEEDPPQTPQRYDRGQHKYDTPVKLKIKYRELGRRAKELHRRLGMLALP